jgi:gas vesicle protein
MGKHGGTLRPAMRATAAVVALSMTVGCANTSQEGKTRAQGCLAGGLLGAVAGAGIGAASGGRNAGMAALIGAPIGLVVGCIAGLATAEWVNAKRREYANNDERIRKEQEIAANNINAAHSYNDKLTAKVASLDQDATGLEQARTAGTVDQTKLKSTVDSIASESKDAQGHLDQLNAALAESERQLALAKDAAGTETTDVAALAAKVQQLEHERDALRASLETLEASNRRISS